MYKKCVECEFELMGRCLLSGVDQKDQDRVETLGPVYPGLWDGCDPQKLYLENPVLDKRRNKKPAL